MLYAYDQLLSRTLLVSPRDATVPSTPTAVSAPIERRSVAPLCHPAGSLGGARSRWAVDAGEGADPSPADHPGFGGRPGRGRGRATRTGGLSQGGTVEPRRLGRAER